LKEEITKLIRLQAIDSEIAGFDKAIARHQAVVNKRKQAIEERQNTLAALREKIALLTEKQQATQTEHDEAGARVKDRQNKMMLVQTPREHQALLKEIEENKRLTKESEDKLLHLAEQLEQLEQDAATQDKLCSGEQDLLAEETGNADKAIRQLERDKKAVVGRREEEAATLESEYIKRYSLLLTRRRGLAVVPIHDNVCQGCYMALPPQQVNEVRKGDRINFCPTCQRILYYEEEQPLEDEAVGQE
jgi:predicted  nucleic acid-binding Zn-ribbon protein